MKIVLLGAPGAGKGSQAELIKEKYGLPHISTGDALRKNLKDETELGLYAKSYMEKGLLVPDSIIVQMMKIRLEADDCKNGYMLDGFPRSIVQAEFLDKVDTLDAVLNIEVPFDVIIERLSGRLSCTCGAIYNKATHHSDKCLKCNSQLYIRADDKEEAIRNRLDVYTETTAPLVDYYAKKGVLRTIVGAETIKDTFKRVQVVLDQISSRE
ncbi:MAG: adenylate kinase [Christensenellaceae bacterium]|jgi:adenylate kinase|nr:adenylate kinase [Christensenellaceae bacterium]